jgi:hypothetical protein
MKRATTERRARRPRGRGAGSRPVRAGRSRRSGGVKATNARSRTTSRTLEGATRVVWIHSPWATAHRAMPKPTRAQKERDRARSRWAARKAKAAAVAARASWTSSLTHWSSGGGAKPD